MWSLQPCISIKKHFIVPSGERLQALRSWFLACVFQSLNPKMGGALRSWTRVKKGNDYGLKTTSDGLQAASMASKLLAMASKLLAMASKLLVMASKLLAASDGLQATSHGLTYVLAVASIVSNLP